MEAEDDQKSVKRGHYSIELIGVASSISAVNKFMRLHPEFFKTNINKQIMHISNKIYTVYTEPINFRDTIHHVHGYITTEIENGEFVMRIFINKANKNKECYIKQVESYVNYQTKYGNNVQLNYYKILSNTIIKHCYYNEPVEQWSKDVQLVQNEFFSPHKQYLFSIIGDKAKHGGVGNTANSWNNLLLYGRAGSGKSSTIYRISMMLKLSILSVDLSLFLNKKKDLYALFHGQEFSLPSNETAKEPAITNAIIVLEEFDYAVEKLLDIENVFRYKDVLKREYLSTKNKEIEARTTELIEEYQPSNPKEEAELNERIKMLEAGGAQDYSDYMRLEMLKDGFDMQNNRVFEKARKTVLKKRDFDNEISGINAELNNIIKSMDDDNKSNILRLSDLLELFQGPAPVKNRVIIATTNNYEKIRGALPALFRAGRLSPVQFEYLDWESLSELCHYYFQNRPECEPRVVNVPTSQLIELAIKNLLSQKTFDEFMGELYAVLDAAD